LLAALAAAVAVALVAAVVAEREDIRGLEEWAAVVTQAQAVPATAVLVVAAVVALAAEPVTLALVEVA
jgi:hypothetical protein